jgi:hypothetical protein
MKFKNYGASHYVLFSSLRHFLFSLLNIIPQHPQSIFFPQSERQSFALVQNNVKMTVYRNLFFVYFDNKQEDKIF